MLVPVCHPDPLFYGLLAFFVLGVMTTATVAIFLWRRCYKEIRDDRVRLWMKLDEAKKDARQKADELEGLHKAIDGLHRIACGEDD